MRRIYDIKHRPRSKPLIIFVSDPKEVDNYVEEMPPFAIKLMEKFWPGPLTLIFMAAETVPKDVIAGYNTVGVRVPECSVVLELIKRIKEPIAVTSANISGKKDLCTAEEVAKELGDSLDYILDAGPTKHKIVSTIVDVSGDYPILTRAGKIKKAQIEDIVPVFK